VPVEKMPKCGKVRTRKRLLMAQCAVEVPTYKCVVKYCCPTCCQDPGCCCDDPCCCDPGCCDADCGASDETEPELAAPAPEAQAYGIAPLPPM
jgi:hypothetical protein